MHLTTTSRPARVRRVLAISAAALAVVIGPTACDYGATGGLPGSHSGDSGSDMPGMDHNSGQQPVVVPVANTSDNRHQGRNHGRGNQPAPTTAPTTAPTATTDPTVTTDPTTTAATTAATTATSATTAAPAGPVAAGTAASANPNVGAPLPDGGNAPSIVGGPKPNNGLSILGRDCTKSKLPLHDGLQNDPAGQGACVNTEMGEVAAKNKLPSLLITDAPRVVGMNQAFTLKVSTRNLVRDRFLGAKAGGYYLESSFLNADGLQRGHFHTACRILPSINEAPDSSVDPAFFLATEDGKSDTAPVTIPVPAIGKTGILQCTSWAGDGSHRTPMMTQANETPAIDSVRIFVTAGNQPVRYDAAGAKAGNARIGAAHAQQAGAQQPDNLDLSVPAAPSAAGAPATAPPVVNNSATDPTTGTGGAAAPTSATSVAPSSAASSGAASSGAASSGAASSGEKAPATK